MARRALLIGSQTYGLTGCEADVALMRDALKRRGFEPIERRIGEDATRAGIVDGFEQLIAAVQPTDAVVVFYSGHGGRVARPDGEARRAAGSSAYFQFIVPSDIDESEDGDFRGLLSEELTALQQRLTDAFTQRGATPNVTTILDCCHSGYLVRDTDSVPKAVELDPKMFRMLGIRARAEQLSSTGGLLTNPHAVRLVACQEEQSAFERPSARGRRHGVLTDSLVTVLDGLGEDELSWTVVGDIVARAVQGLVPEQRPMVEGPARRLLFSPGVEVASATYAVVRRDAALLIEAAPLLGISTGDTYGVLAPQGGAAIGRATVTEVLAGNAVLDVALVDPDGAVPDGARAVVERAAAARRRIVVDVPEPSGTALRTLVDESSRLTSNADGPAFATVVVDGGLVVLDDAGARARTVAEPDDEPGRRRVVELIELLALARTLRELRSGQGQAALAAPVTVRFGTVGDGVVTDRQLHGERLTAVDRVAVSLHNESDETVYFWVFDIGISGRVALVTNAAPSGTLLGPRGSPDDTKHVWDAAGGEVRWPEFVPVDGASPATLVRPESLVVILADGRQDLSALGTPSGGDRDLPVSSLDAVLAEVRAGVRSAPAAASTGAAPVLRYRVETIDFFVTPTPS